MDPFIWAIENNNSTEVPEDKRPIMSQVSYEEAIPIVDMSKQDNEVAQEIAQACEDYGIFQLINHGVPIDLCNKVLKVITELFQLRPAEKAKIATTRHMDDGKIFRYSMNGTNEGEKVPMWAETLFHYWHPDDMSFTANLPEIPFEFRQVIGDYAMEMGSLIMRLLSLISQAFNLNENYLIERLGENPAFTAQANYYPSCPNPEKTLGLQTHTDYNILTVLLQEQGVVGLHIIKDNKWVAVNSQPGALVVNVADQLQVLSNDRFKSVVHRAVTNAEKKRVSYAMFCGPDLNAVMGPIESLLDDDHPPIYHNYKFGEFVAEFRNQEGKQRKVNEHFKIKY